MEPVDRAADVAADVAADIGVQSSDVEPVDRAADVAADIGIQSSFVLACSNFYMRQSETVQVASQHLRRGQRKAARPVRYDC